MCGIAGIISEVPQDGMRQDVERMIREMTHRGPDGGGVVASGFAALGMVRLAIIDVAQAHQPMTTSDGVFTIVFNGEIYNYQEIRAELLKSQVEFHTNSDTETLLQAYVTWGSACLNRLRGMFAFAVLDRRDNSLFIARDRVGVKPLYYTTVGNRLIFASEMKSLLVCPFINRQLNLNAVNDYLALRYVPGPESMIQGIRKLPPGHYLHWKSGDTELVRYWSIQIAGTREWRSSQEAQSAFDECFDEATRIRMLSEKPVGAFLSGGLDSTAIVASLSKQFPGRLRTFSVGFGWEGDELGQAAATAKTLGCEHREVICKSDDCSLLPQIIHHLDEPIGDGIILPMYLVSRLASQHVTVVQSGEGADEILGGYFTHRALLIGSIYKKWIPALIRNHVVRRLIQAAPAGFLNYFFDYPGALGSVGKERLLDFLKVVSSGSMEEQNRMILSLFSISDRQRLWGAAMKDHASATPSSIQKTTFDFNELLSQQFDHWLPDDILCKLDKITMANSIEGRVPFMDHKLIELCMSFPAWMKIGLSKNKLPVRDYLRNSFAPSVANHKKVPFYIPIDRYLTKDPLRTMVEELLSETSVRRRGLFQWSMINRIRNSTAGGGFLFGKQIFSLAMLELWCRIFIDREQGWV